MDLQTLLSRLDNVKKQPNGSFMARCPGHEDHKNSLSVSESDGTILIKCFVGCSLETILAPLSLKPADLFAESPRREKTIVNETAWEILNQSGTVIATHHRADYSDGTKRYYWKRNGTLGLSGYKTAKLPLYGLRYLNGQSEAVILTEGEKAADYLNKAGYLAFGTVCGASSTPNDDVLEILTNFRWVYLWPDADKPGIEHMQRIADRLVDLGIAPKIIDWPDAPAKGDAADYVSKQLSIDALLQTAVIWPPPKTSVEVHDDPHRFALTDTGNAERFVRDHGSILRYNPDRDRWLIWSGKYWEWGDRARTKVMDLAKTTVRNMYIEAGEINDTAARQDLCKHAMHSESEQRRKSMVSLSQSENGIPIPTSEIDANGWLLNCNNGTIDLQTGTLSPHNPGDHITKLIPIDYNYMASCPAWVEFIDQITCGNDDLATYLKKAVGYSLVGDTREQCLFFLYGGGNNGKSTFINTLLKIFGPYGYETSTDIFMVKDRSSNGHNEGLANLQGKRFVAATELEEGQRLATAIVKMATGGERITASRKHEHEISFWPTHTIWISGNHKPRIVDTTDSIWRRVKLVLFDYKLSEDQIDSTLPDKLLAESEGILSWAIQGCRLWQETGLQAPSIVKNATGRYREDEDPIGEFLRVRCVIMPSLSVVAKQLYGEYQGWCDENGERPLGVRRFNSKLVEKGLINERGTGNRPTWFGVGLCKEEG